MKQKFFPEGLNLKSESNMRYCESVSMLERAMADGAILEGRVTLCDNRQNLIVDLGSGIKGVIPRDECVFNRDGAEVRDIAILTRVGKSVSFKVTGITVDETGETVALLSRKRAQRECYSSFIEKLVPGDVIDARITHLENFGAFVDIGCGIISLLSIDCMSVSRISHPRDRFEQGEFIRVAVRQSADSMGRLTLTHKELLGTWEQNIKEFTIGETAAGVVRSIESYGVFVELAPNLAGLAEYRQGVAIGNNVAVYIKSIIPEKMKLKLVLVDGGVADKQIIRSKYFFTGDHISEWVYSPAECTRVIKTVFG